MSNELITALQSAAGNVSGDFYPYTIDNSARFASSSDKLTRTNSGSGSTKGCFSMWVKRSKLNETQPQLIGTGFGEFYFTDSTMGGGTYYPDAIGYYEYFSSSYQGEGTSSINSSSAYSVFRDVSAWYHVFLVWDTTLATATDRYQIWINNQRVTLTGVSNVAQNTLARWFYTGDIAIGNNSSGTKPSLCYLAEVVGVEGTAYAPTDFAQDKNGVWVPKNVSGLTFGTNGFYLDFADSSNLGNDVSGNNNDFTSSGLTSSDQMPDTPTNNFATFNPLVKEPGRTNDTNTYAEGNLYVKGDASANYNNTQTGVSTILYPSSGAWYTEVRHSGFGGQFNVDTGIVGVYTQDAQAGWAMTTNSVMYYFNGSLYVSGSVVQTGGATYTTGDIIGVFVDSDNNQIKFYKNGSLQYTYNSSVSLGGFKLLTGDGASTEWVAWILNAGQNGTFNGNVTAGGNSDANGIGDFKYTVPTGALALCTANLPEPTIGANSDIKPSDVFGTVLYTGNGTAIGSGGKTVDCGVDMTSGDYMVAIKNRDAADSWMVFDTVRGATKYIQFNSTNAEATDTESLTAFTATGVTLGNNVAVNTNTEDYVLYWFKATAGFFDIKQYTGTGVAHTETHNLGVTPNLITCHGTVTPTAGNTNWPTYVSSLPVTDPETDVLYINLTNAVSDSAAIWNDTAPTSSVFTVGTTGDLNQSGDTYIAYLFADVEGFCKIGYYEGNGSADGVFQYLGFSPELHVYKRTDVANSWVNILQAINPTNDGTQEYLMFDDVIPQAQFNILDQLSNGIKYRTNNAGTNASGGDYITLSIGTSSKYSNAR